MTRGLEEKDPIPGWYNQGGIRSPQACFYEFSPKNHPWGEQGQGNGTAPCHSKRDPQAQYSEGNGYSKPSNRLACRCWCVSQSQLAVFRGTTPLVNFLLLDRGPYNAQQRLNINIQETKNFVREGSETPGSMTQVDKIPLWVTTKINIFLFKKI